MLGFLILTAITFSMLGFIIGIWADGFEKLQVIPLLVITPLSFLGGSFLFHKYFARVLAKSIDAESCGLSNQWFSMEFLRRCRSESLGKFDYDSRIPYYLFFYCSMDF